MVLTVSLKSRCENDEERVWNANRCGAKEAEKDGEKRCCDRTTICCGTAAYS